MVVRVKLRVKRRSGKAEVAAEVIAVANAGYEAPTPQLLVSIAVARELGLWPPPLEAEELTYDTAGGPLRIWLIPRCIEVGVVVEDVKFRWVKADLVISPLAQEALINDRLIDELEIVLEAPGKGLWRFRKDPLTKLRESIRPT